MLVQGVGCGDLAVGQARIVQHFSGPLGQIGDIAGIQTNGKVGDSLRHQHLLEHPDGIGHAAFQGVVGVYQQGCVVGIDLTVCLEGLILAVEHLHPGMGHGAASRNAIHLIGQGAGSTGAAANISRSCADNRRIRPLGTTGAKLQHRTALSCPDNPAGLGSDHGLMVQGQQHIGLHQLRLNGRGADG